MSGDCEECGEHCLECTCKQTRPPLVTTNWTKCEDSLPPAGKRVLATDGLWVEVMWYKGQGNWGSLSLMALDITHWMDIPEPPGRQ